MFPGLGMYYTDHAQLLTTAGEEVDDLDDLLISQIMIYLSEVRKISH